MAQRRRGQLSRRWTRGSGFIALEEEEDTAEKGVEEEEREG